MKTTILNRTVLSALMGSALAFGWGAPAAAQAQDSLGRGQQSDSAGDDDAAAKRDARQARKAQADADAASAEAARGQAQAQARQRENEQRQRENEQRQRENDQRQGDAERRHDGNRGFEPSPRTEQVRVDKPRNERQSAPVYVEQPPRQDSERGDPQGRRGSPAVDSWQTADTPRPQSGSYAARGDEDRQGEARRDDGRRDDGRQHEERRDRSRDELIAEQRRQAEAFARQRDQRRHESDRWSRYLQSQHRRSGYRYQQDYWLRLSRQRYDWQNYDYYSDPYFYSAPSYRYYRGGQSYYINNYAADLLRQAINYGYREGIRAGQADRYDGWRFSYRDAYAYQDASYGYRGMYVSYSEYSYYFREGFRRGYEDGYYDNRRYGRYYNGSDNVLQTVLSLILDLRPYR